MNDKLNSLGDRIRLLGDYLGQVIREQAGEEIFALEEEIRSLSIRSRAGDDDARLKFEQLIQQITGDLPKTIEILKAFSIYFGLVNLAEEHERIGILRQRAEQAFTSQTGMDESIDSALATLKREGLDAHQVAALLDDMVVQLVFTAHPTESKRRTTRQILQFLSDQLGRYEHAQYQHMQEKFLAGMHKAVTLLWQSDDSRKRKPKVMDEVRNTVIYFIEHSLFDVIPQIYREFERSLKKYYPDFEWNLPSVLRFGSWIGGDRDGNPFVTNDTTVNAIQTQMTLALERYENDSRRLYELLSPSRSRTRFEPGFLKQLELELSEVPEDEREVLARFDEEPYRQKLILMFRRLEATRQQLPSILSEGQLNERAYSSASEFLDDLMAIKNSLTRNQGSILVQGQLDDLIRRVKVFGFYLTAIDIRQHSGKHEAVLNEVFQRYGIAESYDELGENDRCVLLTREIENPRPLSARLDFSEETNQKIALFRTIALAKQNVDSHCIENYIVSMTESVSDILEVLLLMSDAELFGKLDLVPLFETVDDLLNAPDIMTRLFENPIYQKHLQKRGNQQQIMIGYSDSNKDGGFLRANWMLFTAQRNLAKTCDEHGIKMTLFHGRGGSIGRGGGPANRSILSQPPESIRGRIRITEQGEVVSSRYTHQSIAYRHLQQLINAVICSGGSRPQYDQYDRWAEIMDQISTIAFKKYRSLVEREDFITYFHDSTPIDQIDQMNLGSRPSRRKKTEQITDLRAIPWVFAWTQTRTNIPSWYGVGTAIEQWVSENKEQADTRVEALRLMYRDWPFFRSLMGNVHLGLGRADMSIAAIYAELNSSETDSLYAVIKEEFETTRKHLLLVTEHDDVLDTEPWLKKSIQLRNPYVDPMNYIQVALLDRLGKCSDENEQEAIRKVILQSINGIAAGLQTVG